MNKIDVIVYSKDRTAQLDLLIRSLKKNFKNLGKINVLFDYSSDDFKFGFSSVAERNLDVNFIRQTKETFQSVIKNLVSNEIKTEYVLPLCDDDFMPRETDLTNAIKYFDKNVCGINLRYHPGMHINYLTEQHYNNPEFFLRNNDCLKWKWNDPRWIHTSWGYPYQAGCELYETKHFAHMLNNSSFVLPNSMEGVICGQATKWGREDMMCLPNQHIINISINKVQTENSNRGGWSVNYTPNYLNDALLDGKEIDLEYCESYCKIYNQCDFIEMELQFKERQCE